MSNWEIHESWNEQIGTFCQAFNMTEGEVRNAISRSYTFHKEANHAAVKRVLEKADRGEAITVAAIGGSITEGASARATATGGNNAKEFTEALGGEMSWFNRTAKWFAERFPDTKIHAINAGIGATPSFLGTFRLEEMVLTHKPDLVTVEFSVNDPSTFPNLLETEIFEAYESVVRRCMEAGVAVIQIFMNDQENNGLQHYHSEVAKYYQVPSISYHNAVYPDGKLVCDWVRLSPDDIHPNNAGHAFIATCLCNYLEQLCSTNIPEEIPALPEKWIHQDTFAKVYACYAHSLRDQAGDAFTFLDDTAQYQCRRWKGVLISNGIGTLKVTIPKGAKRVWVQYYHNPGSFETEFNGQQTSCNTAAIGWPRAMWHRVYTGSALEQETVLTIITHKAGQTVFMGVLAAM